MNDNFKTYLIMFIACLIVAVYVKYAHDPLINMAVNAMGIN